MGSASQLRRNTVTVARELAPAGTRSGPNRGDCYAVQREQALSPRVSGYALYRLTDRLWATSLFFFIGPPAKFNVWQVFAVQHRVHKVRINTLDK